MLAAMMRRIEALGRQVQFKRTAGADLRRWDGQRGQSQMPTSAGRQGTR
jgi:hypothetical protein